MALGSVPEGEDAQYLDPTGGSLGFLYKRLEVVYNVDSFEDFIDHKPTHPYTIQNIYDPSLYVTHPTIMYSEPHQHLK